MVSRLMPKMERRLVDILRECVRTGYTTSCVCERLVCELVAKLLTFPLLGPNDMKHYLPNIEVKSDTIIFEGSLKANGYY
jgi:hypothetical protein